MVFIKEVISRLLEEFWLDMGPLFLAEMVLFNSIWCFLA